MKQEKQTVFKLLVNPFERIAGLPALSFGVLFMIIGAMLAGFYNARFDGVIDFHVGNLNKFSQPLVDQGLVWLSLVAIFFPLAYIMGAKPRFIDIAGTFALARLPFAFIPMVNCTGFMSEMTAKLITIDIEHPVLPFSGPEFTVFILLTLIILAIAVWLVALYFNAYRVSANIKGNRLGLSFIAGLIASEVLSIYLIRVVF